MDIGIPTNFIAEVATNTTLMLDETKAISALIIGILLAFLVIGMVVNALQKDELDGQ